MPNRLRTAVAALLAIIAGIVASVGRVRAATPPAHAAKSAEESSRVLLLYALRPLDVRSTLAPVETPTCRWSESTRSFSWLFP